MGAIRIIDRRLDKTVEVAQAVKKLGYAIATTEGRDIGNMENITSHHGFGLIKLDVEHNDSLFSAVTQDDGPREFFGILWIQSKKPEALPKQKWVLCVYNADTNKDEAFKIAQQLTLQFEVNIDIELMQDEPRREKQKTN
jgi:hypothetical protein